MFVRNGRIDLTPEDLKPFPSAREADRFQLVTAAVGGHDTIKAGRVRCEKCLQVAQEVLQEPRLWAIDFQNGPNCRAECDPVCGRYCRHCSPFAEEVILRLDAD
jgi:hypothetical protein